MPISYDETFENDLTCHGEFVRLYKRVKTDRSQEVDEGGKIKAEAYTGIDVITAPYEDFVTWLNRPEETEASIVWFVLRVMCYRFTDKHSEIRSNLNTQQQSEWDMLVSECPKDGDVSWFGRVGFSNFRHDGQFNYNTIDTKKLKHDIMMSVRK